jgi:beta-lactamase superfamily II metal-dependent hydrolase
MTPRLIALGLVLLLGCKPADLGQQLLQDTASGDGVTLVFFDVGQGDAVLIRSPEGNIALVDAGRGDDIVAMLRRYGVRQIDLAVASHGDADHIGGFEHVLRSFPVHHFMDNGVPHNTDEYAELMWSLVASGAEYVQAVAQEIQLGSVTLRVLPPPLGSETEQNNLSVGLVVEYGEFKALLTGDSEIDEINYFLQVGVPDVTVLKAAHHGSRDAVSPAWLSATKPEVVVISCGRFNLYGHPHLWAMRYYEAVAKEIYRTDRDGDVVVRGFADGSYHVETARTATQRTGDPL